MELSYLMLTGSLSGLLSVLAHSVLQSATELVRSQGGSTSTTVLLSDALLHMLCGAGLGLLFWLSWGLAAVVDVPWWVRGLSFASLCWLALVLPTLISAALLKGISVRIAAVIASRWATTCVVAGLACAWSWERAV